jgi:hypothetical protein
VRVAFVEAEFQIYVTSRRAGCPQLIKRFCRSLKRCSRNIPM